MSRISRKQTIKEKEKETQRLLIRERQLRKVLNKTSKDNMVELETPIRKGWVRTFKIRHDIAKTKEATALKQLLDIVQNPKVCDRKDFMIKTAKRKEWKYSEPKMKTLREHDFEKLPAELQKYFSFNMKTPSWGGQYKEYYVYYDWKFETVIKPHYITHVSILHADAQSEYSWIEKKLWNVEYMALKYTDSYSNGGWNPRYERAKSKKEKQKELDEYKEQINGMYE